MESPPIRIGTSSWSTADWKGSVYSHDARPSDYLEQYARQFDTVECDSTFYGIPASTTVTNWRARTPEGFLFSSKLPREITHERGMVDCADTLHRFLDAMSLLRDRMGPVVAQFAYVAKGRDADEYATGDDFRARLAPFLDLWPAERELVVEVRNARWVSPPLLDLLRERNVGLVLPAVYTMPGPEKLFGAKNRPVTNDLVYVRFLGNHRKMNDLVARRRREGKRTADWDAIAVDRTVEMRSWVAPLRVESIAGARVLVYFNNHYAGHAPGSAQQFRQMWMEG